MQLEAVKQTLAPLGIDVAAMTSDSVAINNRFQRQYQVTYPLLADLEHQHADRFGVLNEQFGPAHRFHGAAHPGMLLVDSNGNIVMRFADTDYRQRPDYQTVIVAIQGSLEQQER